MQILRSDKIDFKIKTITKDKEGHYVIIKGSIQEENITIAIINALNIGAPQYIRQTLADIKGDIDSNTVTIEDINIPLTPMDSSSKWKFNKGISSIQFSSVDQSCLTLCDPMNRNTPGLPVHHQLLEFTQTYVHRVGDAIQPSHPVSSPSPPAPNPSQHQGFFQ